jgi:hypothetical protein
LKAFDGLNDWNDWNCAIAVNFEPGTLNFERDRRLERLERFEPFERLALGQFFEP